MSLQLDNNVVTSEAYITDYALGNLSPAKHIIMACQSEISEEVAKEVSFQEEIATSFLKQTDAKPLSPEFLEGVVANLPKGESGDEAQTIGQGLAPKTLRSVLGHGLQEMKWRSMVPGVAVHDVLGNRRYEDGERLYLLKAKGGMKMPEHSHKGEEWSLILTGSYSIGDKTYRRGDLHIEDDTVTHAPHIDEGDDCICLVMTEGPLVMKSWIPKIVQKVVGI
ncbi:ChrR family anti-sigma-E factor [Litorimonas haliclonae]|uniref:ChrR family anti-sigma-E factor n=1 Tax=Litorimonas haliclonae TaxID=2081977 RepID=UPI0039F0808D